MSTVLIVPGLHGSGPEHWQTWFEQRLEGCMRVEQEDRDDPYLPRWAGAVRHALAQATAPVWIVAHSFGCLASVHAAWDYRHKVAGAMLVAPADPEKFKVEAMLPDTHLDFPSVVVASSNDPWMRLTRAAWWADRWGSRFINLGAAGHINVDAGFGPWHDGLDIFAELRRAADGLPLGPLDTQGRAEVAVRDPATRRHSASSEKRLALNWHNWLHGVAVSPVPPAGCDA